MEKIVPVLKPAGYRRDVPLFVKENLFDNPSSPVIAYGIDKGQTLEYTGVESDDELVIRIEEMKVAASEFLKEVHPKINIQEIEGSQLIMVSEHEYASEKILDKEFMIDLASKINAGDLLVGVPFKGQLIAVDSTAPIRTKFPHAVKQSFENPQQDVISPNVFLVREGEIVGMGGVDVSDASANNFSISENSTTHNYTSQIKCSTIEELKEMVNASYQQILLQAMKTKEFGGRIDFHVGGEIEDSPELRKRAVSFVEQISGNELAQTVIEVIAKNKLEARIYLRGVQIAPEDENHSPLEDFSELSVEELDRIFYEITSVPNARTHVPSLQRMVYLMDAYEKLGTTVPSERKRKPGERAKRSESWGKNRSKENHKGVRKEVAREVKVQKKWWEFWK